MADYAWMDDAKCAGMDADLFHPTPGGDYRTPVAICKGNDDNPGCPVRDACLDCALSIGVAAQGVWGGTTEAERKRMRGKRRRRAVAVPVVEGDGDPRHGSTAGDWAGCRCGRCRAARTAYARTHRFGSAS